MTTLFALSFLGALVGLTLGLIRPSLVRLATRKHAALIFGGAALLSFIMVGITLPGTQQQETASPPSTARSPVAQERQNSGAVPATSTSVSQGRTNDSLAVAAQEALKNANVTTMEVSYRGVRDESDDEDAGSRVVTVSYDVKDFFDRDSLMRHTGEISSSAFRSTFAVDPKIRYVAVWYYGHIVDRYGNEKRGVILSYVMDRRTFGKINWNGFDKQRLCDFLNEESQLPDNDLDTMCVPLVRIE